MPAPDTAVTPVESEALPGSIPVEHDMSIVGMFLQADIVVQLVMVMLVLASLWCWAIVFDKWLTFKSVRIKASKFENDFWSADALDSFHEKVKKRRGSHPMSNVFLAGMEEWTRSKTGDYSGKGTRNKESLQHRIGGMMSVARNREVESLERGLGFLATIGSSAPFIGLFGTVWGIMNSFQAIAISKNTSLAVVAPGIAEALFATAIGLFAAIPAVIFYNKFSGELDRFAGRMEDFGTEFATLLSRQIDS